MRGRDRLAHPRHLLVCAELLHSALVLVLFGAHYRDFAVCHDLCDVMNLFRITCVPGCYFSPNVLEGLGRKCLPKMPVTEISELFIIFSTSKYLLILSSGI